VTAPSPGHRRAEVPVGALGHRFAGQDVTMADDHTTPFERDIREQPDALRRLAEAEPPDLAGVTGVPWDRIVLTGMGSSHFAGLPTWRRLTALGHAAWTIDTGRLLDSPELVTPGTLLVVTSQSGASGEVVELLARRASGRMARATVLGIANDTASPLARAADVFVPLHSGAEATVSTKSYLNTLAVHRLLGAGFAGEDPAAVGQEVRAAADAVEKAVDGVDLAASAAATAGHPHRRLAYVGSDDAAATAHFAALITKESAKIPAEAYVGGQFRHGPYELAGDGLTLLVFGGGPGLRRLAADVLATGSHVVAVGDAAAPASVGVPVPAGAGAGLAALAAGAVAAEVFAVQLARVNGVVPGAFVYGSKITRAV
jgi:glutamine---fructose-6-phosphate transaminase (isomerizing)